MVASPTTSITYQNFFSTTLSSDITALSTDIPLDLVPNGSEGFLVIDPDSTTAREIIYYNSKTAVKVVCPSVADGRGQDDTTAGAHLQGTTVIMAPVAAYYETLLSLFTTSPQGWTSVAGTISAVTNNGNRSYDLSTSNDLSATISPGMRLRTTRTVAAPTQSTSLNGTTQYYSKTTPAGMTFTNNFVVSAWVKLTSYPSATNATIASRYNATSGWMLRVNASGQPQLYGVNGASGNYSFVGSYQSIPLNKWVHIAAQLDMATFTATTTTSYIMIDGVDVPATVARAGTNPTALVQAGNLEIGSANATEFFPGKIAQVAIFNAKVTQATIRGYMSQGLAGTETSLISAYSFNNSISDLNANANHLTANGSAVATNADSPFGGQANGTISSTLDYAEVVAVTSSVISVRCSPANTIPTTGGVSAASYSTYASPYGYVDGGKVIGYSKVANYITSATAVDVDISGLTTTVYVPANRTVELRINTLVYSTAGGDSGTIALYEDGVLIEQFNRIANGNSYYDFISYDITRSPSAGSHTYKIMAQRAGGAGTMRFGGESVSKPGVLKVSVV